ncbi:MAG: alkaline shock response membrane anchor protein AmaP [Clostridia bacterium]|nr:alkaline shock response membrane anchor protein AmaP [Clostridia bacterium]
MRLRILDRILVALAGLMLLALCAAIVSQMFFGVDLVSLATKAFTSESPQVYWGLIALAAVLLLLGGYCLLVLFRHRKRKDKFILQKNDSGELAISIKALENMVQKCLDQHDEMTVQKTYLENKKDGLLIRIQGSVAGGISIPLTVEALQKQIRQYVTACSGVEVKGIRVQIESSGEDAVNAPFAIAAPAAKPLLKEPEEKQTPVEQTEVSRETAVQKPVPVSPVSSAPVEQAQKGMPVPPDVDEDDDRPLHQRLFSAQPEPCIMPEPPAQSGADQAAETEPEDSASDGNIESEMPGADTEQAAETSSENAEMETVPSLSDKESDSVSEAPVDAQDTDFLESLSTFDKIVTGEKE